MLSSSPRHRRFCRRVSRIVVVMALGLTSCSGTSDETSSTTGTGAEVATTVTSLATAVASRAPKTLRVPDDFATVQAAVDATVPGDLVLIGPGTYQEAVVISTPRIVLRGLDRNTVVFDGRDELENGILAQADGVAVENLTIHNYLVNGLIFTKAYLDGTNDAAGESERPILHGYRASYVTAYNNGLYGLYAFFAENGLFEHSYASGHPDSGFYVGQCKPCNAVITDVVAEANSLGFEGTNASQSLFIINSVWRGNRLGVTSNTQDLERLAPQGDVVFAGNLVVDNQNPQSPSAAQGAFGLGIVLGGGERNQILRNRVMGNAGVGILITNLRTSATDWLPKRNRVEGNVLSGNGVDLAFGRYDSAPLLVDGSCFTGNTFATSSPQAIEQTLSCESSSASGEASVSQPLPPAEPAAPHLDYRSVPAPPVQPSLADASSAPARPATDEPPKVDITTITVPPAP